MTRNLIISTLLILDLLFVPALSQEPDSDFGKPMAIRLVQAGKGVAWHCTPPGTVAGGRDCFDVSVKVQKTSEGTIPILEEGWPEGLEFDAGQYTDSVFIPDSDLLNLLNIQPGIHSFQRVADRKAWLADKKTDQQGNTWVSYSFMVTIPEQYAGKRILIRATYDSPEMGRISNTMPILIIPQCDEQARQIALGSWVTVAYFHMDVQSTVHIADSLVNIGMTDLRGLMWATAAARDFNLPLDELRFMDLNYQTNGAITNINKSSSLYESRRQELIEIIDQQQQKR